MSSDERDVFKPISSFIPPGPGKQKADSRDPAREWVCHCAGDGLVFARAEGDPALKDSVACRIGATMFRCTCYRGEHNERRYPSWKNAPKGWQRCP